MVGGAWNCSESMLNNHTGRLMVAVSSVAGLDDV